MCNHIGFCLEEKHSSIPDTSEENNFIPGETKTAECKHMANSVRLCQPGPHPTEPKQGTGAGLGVVTRFYQEPRSPGKYVALRQVSKVKPEIWWLCQDQAL